MEFVEIKKLKYESRIFYVFLFIHLLVWSCIGLMRTILPTDSLEGIYWGSLLDFGTPKHPPLAGWITYFAWLPFKNDFVIYLLSQLFVIGGFIYVYKLAKNFLDDSKALLSTIILEGCWVYCYITGYYGFNPDVVLLFTLPAITYYFYKCVKTDKFVDWAKLGIFVGLSLLDKYQTGFLLVGMFIWTLFFKKELFKNPVIRIWMDWLGSFAVDREKLSVSTIKTALSIKKTQWVLGIFPQGTRELPGKITIVNKGFSAIAKASKCGILPVGIVGTHEAKWLPFSGKIVVKIGKLIPYSENVEEMTEKWIKDVEELTGFNYEPKE